MVVNAETCLQLEMCCRKSSGHRNSETLFDREVKFNDGKRFAVQVIDSDVEDEPAWTQGVLFDKDGYELGCTHVGDEFIGEYIVDDYQVEVLPLYTGNVI